ncbi:MAG: hypothetical protein HRT90_02365 [Candidatus Margulisbacteria bacterium]|nr:hypothetical protein [Candidatus Margulisiibacteriota bacterium]
MVDSLPTPTPGAPASAFPSHGPTGAPPQVTPTGPPKDAPASVPSVTLPQVSNPPGAVPQSGPASPSPEIQAPAPNTNEPSVVKASPSNTNSAAGIGAGIGLFVVCIAGSWFCVRYKKINRQNSEYQPASRVDELPVEMKPVAVVPEAIT